MKIMAAHSSAIAHQETPHEINETDSTEKALAEKIEELAEIVCRGGEESAAALFVLMGTLQESSDPKTVAHTAKHLAFTRCGDLNVFGIVDSQIAVLERKLLADC
jgi:hypothetical protein